MLPFLWATFMLTKNHNETPKVAQLAKKSHNLVTLDDAHIYQTRVELYFSDK
jgi:hypothetical protein